jgi:hypothetical protein
LLAFRPVAVDPGISFVELLQVVYHPLVFKTKICDHAGDRWAQIQSCLPFSKLAFLVAGAVASAKARAFTAPRLTA